MSAHRVHKCLSRRVAPIMEAVKHTPNEVLNHDELQELAEFLDNYVELLENGQAVGADTPEFLINGEVNRVTRLTNKVRSVQARSPRPALEQNI